MFPERTVEKLFTSKSSNFFRKVINFVNVSKESDLNFPATHCKQAKGTVYNIKLYFI